MASMKRTVMALAGALVWSVGGLLGLGPVVEPALAESRIVFDSVPSKALGRLLRFEVYLPDGYDTGLLRYPVLYLLHGAGGDETSWRRQGRIKETADRMMGKGVIPPAIIIMPGCRACWWVDGPRAKAETAFWEDLVPTIAERFRVIDERGGRLLSGISAGGYGAVRYSMRYPDRVAAVAALSPAVYDGEPPAISSARVQPPFRLPDGRFDGERWKALNYPSLMPSYAGQSNRVPFYLISGDNDRYGIAFETALLFKRLYELQPEWTELRVVNGGHVWPLWARSIESAMRYVFRFAERPQPVLFAGQPGVMPGSGGIRLGKAGGGEDGLGFLPSRSLDDGTSGDHCGGPAIAMAAASSGMIGAEPVVGRRVTADGACRGPLGSP